jgi:hypothetical protein
VARFLLLPFGISVLCVNVQQQGALVQIDLADEAFPTILHEHKVKWGSA